MRTFVREPDRSPQDVVPCDRLRRCRFRLNKIDAKFDKGVLTITMPKTTKSRKKEIKINKAK